MGAHGQRDSAAEAAGPRSSLAFAGRLGPLPTLLFTGFPVCFGVLLAIGLHFGVVIPTIGTGYSAVTRTVRVGQFLESPLPPRSIAMIGDSVSIEGLDATRVSSSAGGHPTFNFAVNGGTPTDYAVQLPKILAARPAVVLMMLRTRSLGKPIEMARDVANAAALGGFPAAWPQTDPAWLTPDSPGMSRSVMKLVTASEFDSSMYLRTAPVNWFNERVRSTLRRRSFVPMNPDDFVAPAELRISLEGERLDAHLNAIQREFEEALVDGIRPMDAFVERQFSLIAASGARPAIVIAPVHPRLQQVVNQWTPLLREFAARMKERHGAIVIDATMLLDESGFADAQHPNSKGREELSRFIGEALGSALDAQGTR